MTSAPARIIGCGDRGTLDVGKKPDVNVIDLERVAERAQGGSHAARRHPHLVQVLRIEAELRPRTMRVMAGERMPIPASWL